MREKNKEQKRLVENEAPIVGKYGIDLGDRGIYDKRNQLNELTGREWTHFINSVCETEYGLSPEDIRILNYFYDSVIPTRYSTNGKESIGHKIRKEHPSPKPPQLMRDLIGFFTKGGETVLDPFMGVGGTLLGASLLEPRRKAIGIDLSRKYIELYRNVCKQENLPEQIAIEGDARNIDSFHELKNEKISLILTDPPYANMLSRKRTGGDKTKNVGVATPFTDDSRDLGNMSYDSFLPELREILQNCVKYLKPKGYLVIFCKDLQPTKNNPNLLHADLIKEMTKVPGMNYKGLKIWYDKTLNLYPYGYPFSFVVNQLHQYILVFRKDGSE